MGTLRKPLSGLRIGKWFVLGRDLSKPRVQYKCVCDCGNSSIVEGTNLRNGLSTSCGKCDRVDVSIIGTKYFDLTVLSQEFKILSGRKRIYLKCECVCGTLVTVLKNGHTKSCGCIKRKFKDQFKSKKIRISWAAMKQRCLNPQSDSYSNYGAKGIGICERWMKFRNFYDDTEGTWQEGLTIDRYPNKKGNYEPSNFRWATDDEQAQNRSTSKLSFDIVLAIRGSKLKAKELAVVYNVHEETIRKVRKNIRWKNVS